MSLVRTDRFQPQGPMQDPPGSGPFRLELSRAVPLGAVIAAVSALLTWSYKSGGAESSQAALNAAMTDRMARIEAAQAKDMAGLRSDMTERMARVESTVSLRFDAWDKRGDARMAMLTGKFDTADKRDGTIFDQMNALNLRLTRIEALREFNSQNGLGSPAGGRK